MACHILGAPNMALHLSERQIIGVECIKKEGASPFMFPKASVIRFDFAAYGNMPRAEALLVRRPEGAARRSPACRKANDLGDPAQQCRRRPRTGPAGGGAAAAGVRRRAADRPRRRQRPASSAASSTGTMPTLPARRAPLRFPTPDGSLFIGDKGMLTTGTYGEHDAPAPGREDAGLQYARRRC